MERPYTIDHLDHIVLRVSDLERSVAFYSALGGEVCIRRPDNVSLQMCSGTRVTLKLETDYAPSPVNSFDHLNFAVNAENIESVIAYLRERNLPLFEEEGPHTSPSVRILDPEHNIVELRIAGPDAAELQAGSLRRAERESRGEVVRQPIARD